MAVRGGRARLGPIRLRPTGLSELGHFEFGQSAFCSTKASENPMDFVVKKRKIINVIVMMIINVFIINYFSFSFSEGWGPERWGRKISRFFFFHSPATFFILSSLSWGAVSWNIGGDLKRQSPQFSGCRVKPRRPQSSTLRFHSLRAFFFGPTQKPNLWLLSFFLKLGRNNFYFHRFTC